MDLRGHNRIIEALDEAEIAATVVPVPEEGENIEFVTIQTTDETLPPALVLNALGRAGLIQYEGAQDAGGRRGPSLNPITAQPGSTTLRDEGRTGRRLF